MTALRFATVCSGIEAPAVAWAPLGWEQAWSSEIDKFCCELLKQRHPTVPNLGDMTAPDFCERAKEHGGFDVLCGGTPCQSFSVAGLRGGLADERGNLALRFLQLAQSLRPRWLVWENVPGVLSSNGGRDFGAILGGMVELGYGVSYRILDAQYINVAQRRERVFVVGCSRGWQYSAAVLFERHSLSGNPPPIRSKKQAVTTHVIKGAAIGRRPENGPQYGEHLNDGTVYTLNCTEQHAVVVLENVAETLTSSWHKSQGQKAGNNCGVMNPIFQRQGVRRLTPRECERLQGFSDDYTLIDYGNRASKKKIQADVYKYFRRSGYSRENAVYAAKHPDGPRYKALGNSMAVPVVAWIGRRMATVEGLF